MEYRISLVSTYPFNDDFPAEQIFILPVAFSEAGASTPPSEDQPVPAVSWKKKIINRFRPLVLKFRYWLGPYTLPAYGKILQNIVTELQPDLVHALRIPFEGMLAAYTPPEVPLIVSIWGNDFTMHAEGGRQMARLTKAVMKRADGIVADTHRDIRLAQYWGLNHQKETLVVPGGGGINLNEIQTAGAISSPIEITEKDQPLVINPRGIRAYAQTDIFFQAIPYVLQRYPKAQFYCAAMAGEAQALHWVQQLRLQNNVHLLPAMPQPSLWALFHQVQISVSLTRHDGTPNTLLEAMASGCFPIAGDIEALREWITPGVNGLLVESSKPQAVANAIMAAYQNPALREKAVKENRQRILNRAEIEHVEQLVRAYYDLFWREIPEPDA